MVGASLASVPMQNTLPAVSASAFPPPGWKTHLCVMIFDMRESSCGQGPGAAPALPGTSWSWGGDCHLPPVVPGIWVDGWEVASARDCCLPSL